MIFMVLLVIDHHVLSRFYIFFVLNSGGPCLHLCCSNCYLHLWAQPLSENIWNEIIKLWQLKDDNYNDDVGYKCNYYKHNDDDDNLGGDTAIIRHYWFNQGHLLKDHKQEPLQDVDQDKSSQIYTNLSSASMIGRLQFWPNRTCCDHHKLFHPISISFTCQ